MTTNNLEPFRHRKCKECASFWCFHQSKFKASGRHYPKRGSHPTKEKK